MKPIISVINDEIMQKSSPSLECFWDLKISKYVEKLVHVSDEYLRSCVLVSLESVADWTLRISLAYVIPCLKKRLVWDIYSTHTFELASFHVVMQYTQRIR